MARFKPVDVKLSSDQEAEAERIYQQIREKFDGEARRLARLLASKPDSQLFGQTEFEVRDRVHALGAEALEATAEERVKKRAVIKELAASVPIVRRMLVS
jgi:hypothetical protein